MEHILDNPAWNALKTGNKTLAGGNDMAKYFPKEISPFVGISEPTPENFSLLYDTIPFESYFIFISPHDIVIPEQWDTVQSLKCLQMIFEGEVPENLKYEELILITEQHVPQMLELTQLTNPGPFAEQTIRFGHYRGVFDGDKLVAMAGQRLNPTPYAEISAVCTHPDHLGRGYASTLLFNQIRRIKAASEIPFLHVKAENERAIKVYEKLGFVTRKEMSFYVLRKG